MEKLLRQPIAALPLTFFDVETTGLSPSQGDRVCELALRRVRGSHVEVEFATLIDPQQPVGSQAFAVNGISAEMLQGAPRFADVADQVLDSIRDSVLVAHNAPFDVAFLSSELALLGLPTPPNPVIDTLRMARRLLRGHTSYSLPVLAATLGFAALPTHRALQDVLALQHLFEHLVDRLTGLNVCTLDEVLRCERGLLPDEPEPAAPPLIVQALREKRRLRISYRARTSTEPLQRVVQPLELTRERRGVHLRAFCYLRNDLRLFALSRIEEIELE